MFMAVLEHQNAGLAFVICQYFKYTLPWFSKRSHKIKHCSTHSIKQKFILKTRERRKKYMNIHVSCYRLKKMHIVDLILCSLQFHFHYCNK